MTRRLMAEISSGFNDRYLAAQSTTGVNYRTPAEGAYITEIFSSVRVPNSQVYLYYADDATGAYANVIWHVGNKNAFKQDAKRHLAVYVPGNKYILSYGVLPTTQTPGYTHDISLSIVEPACYTGNDFVTGFVYNVPHNAYKPIMVNGAPLVSTCDKNVIRVTGMNTFNGPTEGYLYYADDVTGSNANVLRGYAMQEQFETFDLSEFYITIPAGKYLLARAEIGEWSVGVGVEVP